MIEETSAKIMLAIVGFFCLIIFTIALYNRFFSKQDFKSELFERLEKEKVMDCIECGSCSYSCPSSRPLLDYIRLGKVETGKIVRARKAV